MKKQSHRIHVNGLVRKVSFYPMLDKSLFDLNVACDYVNFMEKDYTQGISHLLKKHLLSFLGTSNPSPLSHKYEGYFFLTGEKNIPDIKIYFNPNQNQIQYIMNTQNMPIQKPTSEEIRHFGSRLMVDLIEHVEPNIIL